MNLPLGTRLMVAANGTVLGTIVLTTSHGFRGGDLNLDTRNGDYVPSLSAGNVVTVKNGATTILSGTLQRS